MPDQQPIGSGFDATSTAADVLAGVDLTGRRALVTGGYSGIGTEVVRALAAAGARVLVPARRPDVALAAVGEIVGVEVGTLDLADQASVTAYADTLLAGGQPVDVVIGNAAVMACPETRAGAGWEMQMATNHLGHFALVNRLWPLLVDAERGARVVSVSSSGHQHSDIRWDDPWFERDYDKWLAYGQSKTANALFAVHLDRHGREHGVRSFSVHPGAILTSLGRHLQAEDVTALLTYDESGEAVLPDFKSPEQGAATAVWAATSSLLVGPGDVGGAYLEDCDVAGPADSDGTVGSVETRGVRAYAVDPAQAARLWSWSAQQCGVDALT